MNFLDNVKFKAEIITKDGETLENKLNTISNKINNIKAEIPINNLKNNETTYLNNFSMGQINESMVLSYEIFKDIPYSFLNGSAVVVNGETHILGSQSSSYYKSHYKYNPKTDTWTEVSTLPYEFFYGSAVVLNGEIHILGSRHYKNSGYINSKCHYKYNLNNNTWTEVSTLPYEFYYGSAVVLNGEIHILGNDYYHYKYIPNSNLWTEVCRLPFNFYNGSAIIFNNEIHAFGGSYRDDVAIEDKGHFKFNAGTNSWEALSYLPYKPSKESMVVYRGVIHGLGGNNDSDNSNYQKAHYKYNSSSDSWERVSDIPYTNFNGVAVVNTDMQLLGENRNFAVDKSFYFNSKFVDSIKTKDNTILPLTWRKFVSFTGSKRVRLPEGFSEIHITVKHTSTYYEKTFTVPACSLDYTNYTFYEYKLTVKISKYFLTSIKCENSSGTDITSECTVTIFYR